MEGDGVFSSIYAVGSYWKSLLRGSRQCAVGSGQLVWRVVGMQTSIFTRKLQSNTSLRGSRQFAVGGGQSGWRGFGMQTSIGNSGYQ